MNALCRTLAVALLLLPACVQGQPSDRAKAESLLRSMRQAVPTRPDPWRVETETHVDSDRGKDDRATDTYVSNCLRAGNKIDAQSKAIAETDPLRKGRNPHLGTTYRGIFDGWALSYQVPPAGRRAGFALFWPDGTKVSFLDGSKGLGAFEGWFSDNLNIADVLLACPNLHVRGVERIGTHDCRVVEGKSEYGSYTIWIDPETRCYPRKISVLKSADDLYIGKKLKDWHMLPGHTISTEQVVSFEMVMDNAEFKTTENVLLPDRCRVVATMIFSEGSRFVRTYDTRCTKVDLHAEVDRYAFIPLLEEGATLPNQQDLQKPYRWHDGKPVPKSTLPTKDE